MRTSNKKGSLKKQIKRKIKKPAEKAPLYDGNVEKVISTGSTLLDLAISGGRIKGGGLPTGILVEIFGAAGSGKTVLLSEIAGMIQRTGGKVMFNDPEARLNKQFATIFDLDIDKMEYDTPDTVTELFTAIRKWNPEKADKNAVNGIVADSLAALSTNLEMDKDEGDKMGMRRAKEFSEELRKTCRVLAINDLLLVCSNQVRVNQNAGLYGQKYISPGGEAIGFYSSVRLRIKGIAKLKAEKSISGKKTMKIIGITITIEVHKNSVWKPYRNAQVSIIFDYGIDDIRENLAYVKKYTSASVYFVNDTKLDKSMDKSIAMVEAQGLEKKLKKQTIKVWEMVESKFDSKRKKKKR